MGGLIAAVATTAAGLRSDGATAISGGGKDFSGKTFLKESFQGGDYSGKDFSGCVANFIDFTKAKFVGNRFYKADLADSRFTDSDLSGASFEQANLAGVDFSGANLEGCYFTDSIVEAKNFKSAKFTDALIPPKAIAQLCRRQDVQAAKDTSESIPCP